MYGGEFVARDANLCGSCDKSVVIVLPSPERVVIGPAVHMLPPKDLGLETVRLLVKLRTVIRCDADRFCN